MKYFLAIFGLFFLGVFAFFMMDPPMSNKTAEYQEWAKKHERELALNRNYQSMVLDDRFKFERLELIEVSPGEKYYSWWGHILLHFVGSGPTADEDLVLSFLADFNDHPVDKWKASFGGYEVMPKLSMLKEYKEEYIKLESREMKSYVLLTNTEQQKNLLNILREWIKNPKKPGGYSFFYNNCVSLLNKLLYEAKILDEPGIYGYWPKYVPGQYAKAGLLK